MGFFYRKSVNFGPIRLNFSKSGIGVSAGVRGARVSTGPRGTYVHAGTNGFYYRQRIDGTSRSPNYAGPTPIQDSSYAYSSDAHRIHSADVSSFVDTSNAKLIEQINTRSKEIRYAPIVGIATLVTSVLAAFAVASLFRFLLVNDQIAIACALVIAGIVVGVGVYFTRRVHKGDEVKRTTPLFYELEEEASTKFIKIAQANHSLSRASRMWRVQTQQSTWDWKRNAGASSLVTRTSATVRQEQPPYIATNVDVWSMRLNDQTLYFMPDYIFVRQNGIYGAISYETFQVDFSPTRFIEDQAVPPDSRVLDYTWQYVNKKGGPDRRFSNNRQIHIVEYGFLHLATASGLNIHLHVSSVGASEAFFRMVTGNVRTSTRFHETRRQSETRSSSAPPIDSKLKRALETLEVSISSTGQQITAAYRQMAKMYHPDRLAHLAPEFVEMAEERMKEINLAYQTLKQFGRV
jgi:hypothetical protein